MPFFLRPQPAFPQEDFFSLLSALDEPRCAAQRKQHCQRQQQQQQQQTFTPRFDVLETPTAYELYGEVPGLTKDSLTIEFEDVQTLVLKGKTARPEAFSLTSIIEEEKASFEAAEVESEQRALEKEKESHHATVEDDYDVADTPLSSSSSTTTTAPAAEEKKTESETKPQAPKAKYWVSERRVGAFERKFSFSQRLEIDGVTAELRDGVLRVVVPKSQRSKKVAVSLF